MLDDSFWFVDHRNAILVCGPKAIFTLSFPLLLVVHNTCAGEKEVERAQDYVSQMEALVEHFKRSERLRASSPFLSKFLNKDILYRCEKAKVHTCMATEKAKRFRACHGEPLPSRFFLCALASVFCMAGQHGGSQATVAFSLNGCSTESEPIRYRSTCRSL